MSDKAYNELIYLQISIERKVRIELLLNNTKKKLLGYWISFPTTNLV